MAHGRTRVPEIRKGDTVLVLTGKDAGKQGVVERVITNAAAIQRTTGRGADNAVQSRKGYWKPVSSRPVYDGARTSMARMSPILVPLESVRGAVRAQGS